MISLCRLIAPDYFHLFIECTIWIEIYLDKNEKGYYICETKQCVSNPIPYFIWECDYLPILGLKLIHDSKGSPCVSVHKMLADVEPAGRVLIQVDDLIIRYISLESRSNDHSGIWLPDGHCVRCQYELSNYTTWGHDVNIISPLQ